MYIFIYSIILLIFFICSKSLIEYLIYRFTQNFDIVFILSIFEGFAQQVLENGPNPRNGSKTDNAHPPIHPLKYTDNLQVS